MSYHLRITLVVLCACFALTVQAQFGHFGGLGYNTGYVPTSFGSPNYNGLSSLGARDPRSDTGPVVFPPSPPGDPSQTSGVVVGASGYGFVPPGSQGFAQPRYIYNEFYVRR